MNITSTYFYFCVLYYAILQIIAPTLSVGWLIVIYVTLFILIMRKPQWLYYFYGVSFIYQKYPLHLLYEV